MSIPARAWNSLRRHGRDEASPQARTAASNATARTIVYVRNQSGDDRDPHDVLTVSGVAITYDDNPTGFLYSPPLIDGDTPEAGGTPLILIEPIADGEIGRAAILGVCPCKVNVTDSDHEWADVTDGDASQLTSGTSGPIRLLWKDGTGEGTICLGLIGSEPGEKILIGKTDAAISKGASGTVSIYEGTPGSETDSGQNLTCYNRFANVGSGKWIAAFRQSSGAAYLIAAEC